MSSFQFVLAYRSSRAMSLRERQVRIAHTTAHLESLVKYPLHVSHVGDEYLGLIAWTQSDSVTCSWPQMATRGNEGVAWLHFPYRVDVGVTDAFDLGDYLARNTEEIPEFGAPLGLIFYTPGRLTIANDVFALARLAEFEFDDLTVWSTRAGVAHIFSGVSPKRNDDALAGLATINWPVAGHWPIGQGRHLPGLCVIHATRVGINHTSNHANWVERTLHSDLPSTTDVAMGMRACLKMASHYQGSPTADLSGGKDSRVIAAAALTAGVTDTVETIDKDPGEVAVAQELVGKTDFSVNHVIRPVETKHQVSETPLMQRLRGWARSHEGHMISVSAMNTAAATRRASPKKARFNGLGGEAMQGGNFAPERWRQRAQGKGIQFALGRAHTLASRYSAIDAGKCELVAERLGDRVRDAASMGISTPVGQVGYIYLIEEMPYWSLPFSMREMLVPFYCAPLTKYMIQSLMSPFEYGHLHRRFLKELIPEWANVDFYRGSPKTNRSPLMWERSDWHELASLIAQEAENSDTFNERAVADLLTNARDGHGGKTENVVFSRILWQKAIEDYRDELCMRAGKTAEEVAQLFQS